MTLPKCGTLAKIFVTTIFSVKLMHDCIGKSAISSLPPCPQSLVNLFRNFDGKNYTTFLTTHETEPIEPLRQLTKQIFVVFFPEM